MFDLIETKTPQVSVIPRWMLLKVYKILDFYKIEHKGVPQSDFEQNWPKQISFNGKIYSESLYAVIAYVTSESLFKTAEEADKLSHEWIEKYLNVKENNEKMPVYLERFLNNITEPFHPVLELVNTPQTLIAPGYFKRNADILLKKRGISYEAIPQKKPHNLSATYCGETYTSGLYAITTCVSTESLHKALEDIDGLLPEEIE